MLTSVAPVILARLGRLLRPGGRMIVSVPARPTLYSEFDSVQGHRRRYLPKTLRDAFARTGLVVDETLWWGQWMVPVLERQRNRQRAQPGESALVTYRRYLKVPAWPISLALRAAFALDHLRTLNGLNRTGTSLIALAHRPTS